jgi:hypothetical protein
VSKCEIFVPKKEVSTGTYRYVEGECSFSQLARSMCEIFIPKSKPEARRERVLLLGAQLHCDIIYSPMSRRQRVSDGRRLDLPIR